MGTAHAYLLVAIMLEVVGTSFLASSQQFAKLVPTLIMAVCYLASFYLLSLSLRELQLGIAYALWSGLGIVLTAGIGMFVFRQVPDAAAVIGIGLIIAGVLVINLFSQTSPH